MKKKTEIKEDDPLAEDWSGYIGKLKWRKARFTFAPKDSTVTIRISKDMVELAKKVAKKKGVKYHKMMRDAIIDFVVKAA